MRKDVYHIIKFLLLIIFKFSKFIFFMIGLGVFIAVLLSYL